MSVGPPPPYEAKDSYGRYAGEPYAPAVSYSVPPNNYPYPSQHQNTGYATRYSNAGGPYDNQAFGAHPAHAGVGNAHSDNVEQGRTAEANQWNISSFSDKRIRQAFIKKVYLILMSQLGFTFAIVCVFSFCQPIKVWVRSGSNQAFYWVSYAVFLVTYIILVCVPSVRRKVPGNYICLGIFTLALTYMTATISRQVAAKTIIGTILG